MHKRRILIAGGSGLIGTVVKQQAEADGFEVILLSRTPGPGRIAWNPAIQHMQIDHPQVFDAIINLAGSSIAAGRWTKNRRQDILQSRLESCHTIWQYLSTGMLHTRVYIGASGVGIYGNSGDVRVTDDTLVNHSDDWLANITGEWEAAHLHMRDLGVRTVITRIGLVLSMKGGALRGILGPAKFGVLACFGNGRQYWPWIHIQDMARILLWAVQEKTADGTYLAVSPNALSNRDITKTINGLFRPKRIVIPVPRWALAILLGQMHHVLFDSCHAYPSRVLHSGFNFRFDHLGPALKDLFGK